VARAAAACVRSPVMEESLPPGGGAGIACAQTDLAADLALLERAAAWSRIVADAHRDPVRRDAELARAARYERRARALRQ
jgi:hypothetical protein